MAEKSQVLMCIKRHQKSFSAKNVFAVNIKYEKTQLSCLEYHFTSVCAVYRVHIYLQCNTLYKSKMQDSVYVCAYVYACVIQKARSFTRHE